jgi:hypothetical protein
MEGLEQGSDVVLPGEGALEFELRGVSIVELPGAHDVGDDRDNLIHAAILAYIGAILAFS